MATAVLPEMMTRAPVNAPGGYQGGVGCVWLAGTWSGAFPHKGRSGGKGALPEESKEILLQVLSPDRPTPGPPPSGSATPAPMPPL